MEAACFYILYNDYIIRTVGGVVVLKKGCQCGWLPESFPETGMRAVFVISQAPDSAYVRIEYQVSGTDVYVCMAIKVGFA